MTPLQHGDAGFGRQLAIVSTVAIAATLGWAADAWTKARGHGPRSGIHGWARSYVDALPLLGFLDVALVMTDCFGMVAPSAAAVGGLASIVVLAVIGGVAVFVLEGSPSEEMELR
jgi:hypothetical protein